MKILNLVVDSNSSSVFFMFTFIFVVFVLMKMIDYKVFHVTICAVSTVLCYWFIADSFVLLGVLICLSVVTLAVLSKVPDLRQIIVFSVTCVIIISSFSVFDFENKIAHSSIASRCQNMLGGINDNILTGNKETEIEVVMSDPAPMYFRTNYQAEMIDTVEFSDTFKTLFSLDFYPQTQTQNLSQNLSDMDFDSITVNVKSSAETIIPVPYGVVELSNFFIDESYLEGKYSENSDDVYSFKVNSDFLTQPQNMKLRLANLDSINSQNYMRLEQAYRKFVYSVYNDNIESEKGVLDSYLQADNSSSKISNMAQIRQIISQNCTADEKAETYKQDLAAHLLEQECVGNEEDFAALTVEMLRWYSIPARLCSGYVLTDSKTDKALKNTAFTLTDDDFHYWAEYYEDGIGWLPFETYPDYLDFCKSDMKFDTAPNNSDMQQYESDISKETENITPQTQAEKSAELPKSNVIIFVALVTFVSIIILALIFFFILKGLYNRRFSSMSEREKVIFCFSQGKKLLETGFNLKGIFTECFAQKLSERGQQDLAEQYEKTLAVYNKAMFSQFDLSAEELEISEKFYADVLSEFGRKLPLYKRICFRYFYFTKH